MEKDKFNRIYEPFSRPIIYYEPLTEAIIFAADAHHLYLRKDTDIPYIFHAISVGRILCESHCIVDVVKAGILHDVLEDTITTPEEVGMAFGKKVLKYVMAVTEFNKEEPWEVRKKAYIETAKTANLRIVQIMCADKLDNISEIAREIETDGDEVWEKFNAPKNKQEWYYKSLVKIFLERFIRKEDIRIAQKLKLKIEEVFNER
jgi:(p)ppGpp synthase/HD superfamily hydrolase